MARTHQKKTANVSQRLEAGTAKGANLMPSSSTMLAQLADTTPAPAYREITQQCSSVTQYPQYTVCCIVLLSSLNPGFGVSYFQAKHQ